MEWIDRLAEALGVEALDERQTNSLLVASREVAHRVERKTTPLAAYLMGAAAGGRVAEGRTPSAALDEVLAVLDSSLPTSIDADPDG